ncbi:MAG: acyltransferase [Proteobacteria bacterium]|nr:acyltransferase [Pseudomonadota bacterium]
MNAFQSLPGPLQGVLSLLGLFLNTVFWCLPLFAVTFIKLVVPTPAWYRLWGAVLNRIATNWVYCNNLIIRLTKSIRWEVSGLNDLAERGWYLVLANHQSWLDIVVLQKVFYRRIPFLKFFLKKELIWVPLLGQAWWALDFPFMKRHSRAYLEKHPERKGQDLETTRKACAKFKHLPVAIMNFVEGTRYNPEKARRQKTPYARLLKPKAAGVAFVLGAMGEHLTRILNVTISYPQGEKSLWDFMCGRVRRIKVDVEVIPITRDLLGDYFNDRDFQGRFQDWLNEIWARKDKLLEASENQGALAEPGT